MVVDLETTGNAHYKGDRIIQISAVTIINLKITDQYTTFVNPGISIPPFIEELTGIDDQMLENAPSFTEIAVKIKELLTDAIFVAHNVLFDLGFLENELKEAGLVLPQMDSLDTVELAKILLPEASSYKLADLSEQLELSHLNPHQADSDALVTAELLLLMLEKAKSLPLVTLEKLADFAVHLKSDISMLFNSILASKRKSVENLPEQLEVFRGIALRKKQKPELILQDSRVVYPLDDDEKNRLLKKHIDGYEIRGGQLEMMDAVHAAFTNEQHAIIEAGTGIGKSLAYLFPALYFAVTHRQPVIISTYTIQMQDQLVKNEIARLSEILPFSFRAAILKGRNNYINMLKFEQALKDYETHFDSVMTIMQLLVWLLQTETGDMDELNFSSGGHLFRQRIRHDGWFLSREKDPWLSRDFYMHARENASNAHIVITNHAMLLKDMANEEKLLPDYHYAVIDEAHQLEQAARKGFGNELEYNALKYLIGRLGTFEKRQLFFRLEQMIEGRGIASELHSFELESTIYEMEAEIDDLFMLLSKVFIQRIQHKQVKNPKQHVRLDESIRNHLKWRPVLMCAERVLDLEQKIESGLRERLELLRKQTDKMTVSEQAFMEEVNSFLKEWAKIGVKLKEFMIIPQVQDVIWLEGDTRMLPNTMVIHGQPESPGNRLAEHFFGAKKSVVMTSATLAVNGSFSYIIRELGISHFSLLEKQIASPFDFKQMAKLMIPTDLPEIRLVSSDEYIEAISSHLVGIAEATEGRMLVLFTSYDMLRKTYNLMKDSGALDEFILLAQGISPGSRSRLTKSFQQFNKAILFGTSSFWEGVDIPGKDLSCLVIVRLPFSPPDEPVKEAKYEAVKRLGKNPFTEYSLPEAVIRFKQGFGRLIRSETDRGVIVVLDRRIDTTVYGKAFLRSIPDVTVERGPLEKIIGTIEKWL